MNFRVATLFAAVVLATALPGTLLARDSTGYDSTLPTFQCPSLPQAALPLMGDVVFNENDTIKIKSRSGKMVEFRSVISPNEDEETKNIFYCIKNFFPDEQMLFIDFTYWEGGGFHAVNINTGESSLHLATYTISPDRKRLFLMYGDYGELDLIQVLKITPCGLVHEFSSPSNNALRRCNFSWKDADSVEMTLSPMLGDDEHDLYMGRIRLDSGLWRFQTTVLYNTVLNKPLYP